VVWDVEDLPEAVAATPRRADALVRGTGPLHDAVRTALGGRAGVRRGQLAGQRRFLQRAG
jgi:hypothetical protein